MKHAFLICMMTAIILGCSKQTPKTAADSIPQPQAAIDLIPTDPNAITLIETATQKDKLEIEAVSARDFAAKDFDKLDELANGYRKSKDCYAMGTWKLDAFYYGMIPDQKKSDAEWDSCIAAFHDWIQKKPNSITARVALANTLVCYGWKARGSGYANTVTDAGAKLLGERLGEAVQVLKDAGNLQEKCPCLTYVLMSAALELDVNRSQYDFLFQKSIASEPDFTGYYWATAYYLTPRWHGSKGAMAAFLNQAADQIGGDDGDLLYARVAWHVELMTAGATLCRCRRLDRRNTGRARRRSARVA